MMTDLQKMEQCMFEVDPARLAPGEWCHRREKDIGQGDICSSYSADRIAMDQPVRRPFEWRGSLWTSVSMFGYGGVQQVEAYRLIHPQRFSGEPTAYCEKTRDGDAARADPNGFYHGMSVWLAGQTLVIGGLPVSFTPGQVAQLDLTMLKPLMSSTPNSHWFHEEVRENKNLAPLKFS